MDLPSQGWKIIFARVKRAALRMKFGCLCTDMTEGSEMLPICEAVEIKVLYFGI
jgi:hypothetical protein